MVPSDATTSLTVTLPRSTVAALEALAQQTGRDVGELADEALLSYIGVRDSHLAAIAEAIAEANAGARRIEHADVAAWMRSWGTANELPPPV
jgi:predicted transcriptional regulator